MARLYINTLRKDGKFSVTYAFSNGVCLKKIRTAEQIKKDHEDGYEVVGKSMLIGNL